MSKHSPAPWTCDGRGAPVKDATGEIVALVYAEDHKEHRSYWQCGMANRNLIAASPLLLAALEEARTVLSITRDNIHRELAHRNIDRWEGVPDVLDERIKKVDAAIALARGEKGEG